MTNKVKFLRVRWRSRKLVTYVTSILISALILIFVIEQNFAKYTERAIWQNSCCLSIIVYVFICIILYSIIYSKSKRKIYYINLDRRICIKKKKKIFYTNYRYSQTLVQIVFDIVDIELYNSQTQEKIKLKDVSKKVLEYLEKGK